ncbi:hypothetical protein AB0K51_12780 [Kitasatospora sp. NPDC049285]|uniref:hypothetical protein n=1 Tax=Kitasatospora sp. NPDC049285 TaxID=3157096 RepID=UPI00341C64EE
MREGDKVADGLAALLDGRGALCAGDFEDERADGFGVQGAGAEACGRVLGCADLASHQEAEDGVAQEVLAVLNVGPSLFGFFDRQAGGQQV